MDDTSDSNMPTGPEPGERAPAHLSVPATRPIETLSREATAVRADRVAIAFDEMMTAVIELNKARRRKYRKPSRKNDDEVHVALLRVAYLAVAYAKAIMRSEGGRNAEVSG